MANGERSVVTLRKDRDTTGAIIAAGAVAAAGIAGYYFLNKQRKPIAPVVTPPPPPTAPPGFSNLQVGQVEVGSDSTVLVGDVTVNYSGPAVDIYTAARVTQDGRSVWESGFIPMSTGSHPSPANLLIAGHGELLCNIYGGTVARPGQANLQIVVAKQAQTFTNTWIAANLTVALPVIEPPPPPPQEPVLAATADLVLLTVSGGGFPLAMGQVDPRLVRWQEGFPCRINEPNIANNTDPFLPLPLPAYLGADDLLTVSVLFHTDVPRCVIPLVAVGFWAGSGTCHLIPDPSGINCYRGPVNDPALEICTNGGLHGEAMMRIAGLALCVGRWDLELSFVAPDFSTIYSRYIWQDVIQVH